MKESGIELMFSIIIGCIGIYATMFLSTTIGPSLAGEEVYGVFLFAIRTDRRTRRVRLSAVGSN